jgi:hypothetical protein
MSGAHSVTWWGSLDPYTFGCWFSEDKIFDLPDPREANRQLLRSFAAPPDEQHREYIESLESAEARATAHTAFTAYVHEWRHWYDMTSTPFGLTRMAQLAGVFATVSQLDAEIRARDQLFVPLYRWVRDPELIALAHPGLEAPSPMMCQVVERAHSTLRKADHGLRATLEIEGHTVSTTQILEGLAMLAQEDAAASWFGKGAAAEIRRSIKQSVAGARYYTAVDLLSAKGCLSTECQTKILETTLFVNYGVYGSTSAFTPPVLLKELLERGNFNDPDRLDVELDRVLMEFQGFDRRVAHLDTYNVSRKHYDQMLEGATEGLPGAQLRRTIAVAMRSAALLGGAARFREQLRNELGSSVALPEADPYIYRPPFYVEGFPGRIEPESSRMPIETLAGACFPSMQAAREALPYFEGVSALDDTKDAEPHTLSVVWTPFLDEGQKYPDYMEIIKIFRELMYWRGILFGRRSISPFTYYFAVEVDIKETGQVWFD